MANKIPLKKYYDLIINDTEKLKELNLTDEQVKFLGVDYFSKISTEERDILKKLENDTQTKIVTDYFVKNPEKKESGKPKNEETPYKLVVNQLHSFKSVFEKNSKKLSSAELKKVLEYAENILPTKEAIDKIITDKEEEEAKIKAEKLQKEIDEAEKLLKAKKAELELLTKPDKK